MNRPLIPEKRFRRLLMAGLLWPTVVVILFCFSLFWVGYRAGVYRDRYLAAEVQDTAARELRTELLDMETGIRGYLLTGNRLYLEPADRAQAVLDRDMRAFIRASEDEPSSRRATERIRIGASEWQKTASELRDERQAGRPVESRLLTLGKLEFDSLRKDFDDLLSSNSARISIRSSEWNEERRAVIITLVAGAIIVVGALMFVVLFLLRRLSEHYHAAIAANESAGLKVHELNADLEQRVKDRTVDLTRANQELEAFSYSVSHDLRAPLRSIASFSAIIQQDIGTDLDPESADNLKRIRAAAAKMTALIDALLKFSRIARTDLNRSQVDMTAMAESIVSDIRRDNSRPVEVAIQPNMKAEADPHLIRVVFENLLENAWKFSSKNDHPKVEVGEKAGVFYVRDNGVGFEQQYVEKAFLPFERLHKEGDFPGTGIGLATTKRIIDRHGGRIWAESVVNHGATFYFTLSPGPTN